MPDVVRERESTYASSTSTSSYQRKAGDRIGKYVLEKPLGLGGFAEVWLATENQMGRPVAIKIFLEQVVRDEKLWAMIMEEARKHSRLESEWVVPIYHCELDIQNTPGPYFIVMKYMAGGSLEKLLETRHKLPVSEAVRIVRQVIEGLRVAHAAGLIHRDISPSNILFDIVGRAALTDFGIAKDTRGNGKTVVGSAIIGKPDYMSPEQGQGKPVTRASDIYSLGTVLYEMLTGTLPFTGQTDIEVIIARNLRPAPVLREVARDVPQRISNFVGRSLEIDPELRFKDCEAFSRGLDWATCPDRPRPKWVVAAAAAVVIIAVLAWVFLRPSAPQVSPRALVPTESVVPSPPVHDSRPELNKAQPLPPAQPDKRTEAKKTTSRHKAGPGGESETGSSPSMRPMFDHQK